MRFATPSIMGISAASLTLGVIMGFFIFPDANISHTDTQPTQNKQPLYWVAPMDDNYRRDKPGKSPMGMDLVPVYANSHSENSPGTISISPTVINNLGVRSATAQKIQLQHAIKTVGIIQYDENKLIHIHPRVAGWIEKLHVKSSGDPVKKGQALYELYSPELVNAQQEFIAELNRNHTQLIAAAQARLQALQVSEKTIKELKTSKQIKQTITFYSPQDGVVDNLNIREGFYAQPGSKIMSIGSLDQVWLEAEIFERQASFIQTGQKVSMTLDYLPGNTWHGKVDYIYPSLNEQNRTLRARVEFDNQARLLKPNMFAKITIHANPLENITDHKTLAIPKEALIRTGTHNKVVLDLGKGKFKSIKVNIGALTNSHVEIIEGLKEGDKVVTSAQFLLDSESSKSSDFKPLTYNIESNTHGKNRNSKQTHKKDSNTDKTLPSAMANGVINSIHKDRHSLNISRGPIKKWNRGPATLDFQIAQPELLKQLKANDHIEFHFIIDDGEFIITKIQKTNSKINNHIKSKAPKAKHNTMNKEQQ